MSDNLICNRCDKPIIKSLGYHMIQFFDEDGLHSVSVHWDCIPEYSGKVDMILEDVHSGTQDGAVEIGHEVYHKKTFKDEDAKG